MTNTTAVHEQITLQCQNRACRTRVRLTAEYAYYCPVCGTDDVTTFTGSDPGYYESLAMSYGMSVAEITRLLAQWDIHKYQRFSDFMASREDATP